MGCQLDTPGTLGIMAGVDDYDSDSDSEDDSDFDIYSDDSDETTLPRAHIDKSHRKEVRRAKKTIFNTTTFPFTISWVCAYWRTTAIAMPQLWTRIILSDYPHSSRGLLCLERSKSYPLDITVDCRSGGENAVSNTLALLNPHRSRCASLRVRADSFLLVWAVLSHFVSAEPVLPLERLALTDNDGWALRAPDIIQSDAFAKLLLGVRDLHLQGFHIIPWESPAYINLTHLSLSDIYIDQPKAAQFEAIMRGCPMLESLDLCSIGYAAEDVDDEESLPDEETEATSSPIIMGSLEKMRFRDIPTRMTASLLAVIEAPALRSVALDEVEVYGVPEGEEEPAWQANTRRAVSILLEPIWNTPKQWRIQLSDVGTAIAPFIVLFHKSPSITSLRLSEFPPHDILKALTPDDLCPDLELLVLDTCDHSTDLAGELQTLIKHGLKSKRRRPLQHLIMGYEAGEWQYGDISWFREHVPRVTVVDLDPL
ncbi:hypothetical protein BOTBODRAFT_146861 [Botryobasidium botryosum FD-172 SS1]|uniref:F-box domain-containing protein n=1 Tax=Botryobasidium botryosum (strain FD-172 SS1) TaxID=930990 RepID=A0A067MBS2_BOTB1|nr:hypothetical protein BOTBODRAFT_146861 [Botryobasidium botryosum FD-172 SS1]